MLIKKARTAVRSRWFGAGFALAATLLGYRLGVYQDVLATICYGVAVFVVAGLFDWFSKRHG